MTCSSVRARCPGTRPVSPPRTPRSSGNFPFEIEARGGRCKMSERVGKSAEGSPSVVIGRHPLDSAPTGAPRPEADFSALDCATACAGADFRDAEVNGDGLRSCKPRPQSVCEAAGPAPAAGVGRTGRAQCVLGVRWHRKWRSSSPSKRNRCPVRGRRGPRGATGAPLPRRDAVRRPQPLIGRSASANTGRDRFSGRGRSGYGLRSGNRVLKASAGPPSWLPPRRDRRRVARLSPSAPGQRSRWSKRSATRSPTR
jgi:hypothetical protein